MLRDVIDILRAWLACVGVCVRHALRFAKHPATSRNRYRILVFSVT